MPYVAAAAMVRLPKVKPGRCLETLHVVRERHTEYACRMMGRIVDCLGEHSDLRLEAGALIFPMPVEFYDRLMDGKCLPRGACYNGPRGVLEVDAVPNGRYHDPRADAAHHFLDDLHRLSKTDAYAGTTSPLEGNTEDRRHPDAQLFVSSDKLNKLRAASRPAPIPDLVVEIDTTPLSRARERERQAAYGRLGVPELWRWKRVGGSEAEPEGRASVLVAQDGGYGEVQESGTVPGLGPRALEELLGEPDDLARRELAERLAARLAPAFARRWGGGTAPENTRR